MLQVSFVGATEEAAREAAQKNGYGDKVAVVKTSFKANSKVGLHLLGLQMQHCLMTACGCGLMEKTH